MEAAAFAAALRAQQRWLARQGARFVAIVSPSAPSIYPEMLPDWVPAPVGRTTLDDLMGMSPPLPLIDPRSALIAAKAKTPPYTKLNSHWNGYGAWVGWTVLAEAIVKTGLNFQPAFLEPPEQIVTAPDLLNEFPSYSTEKNPWPMPIFSTPFKDVLIVDPARVARWAPGATIVAPDRNYTVVINPGAKNTQRVLVFGDSTGHALSPYLNASFLEVVYANHHWNSFPPNQTNFLATVEQFKPDLVILVMAERFLGEPLGNYYLWYSLDLYDALPPTDDLVWPAGRDEKGFAPATPPGAGDVFEFKDISAPAGVWQAVIRIETDARSMGAVKVAVQDQAKPLELFEEAHPGRDQLYFRIPVENGRVSFQLTAIGPVTVTRARLRLDHPVEAASSAAGSSAKTSPNEQVTK
jgi:hypothetical protein